METTAVSGSVAGVRNITLLGVARYVWVRCIIWQSLDGKINWDRGGYGFSSYREEVLVVCQKVNVLNDVQVPSRSVKVSPSASAGLKFHSVCLINCFVLFCQGFLWGGGKGSSFIKCQNTDRLVLKHWIRVQIYISALAESKNWDKRQSGNGTVRSNVKSLHLEVVQSWSSGLAWHWDTRHRSPEVWIRFY